MFVQTTTSKRKGGKTYVSYLVRESFRTSQGPRSRTVCNISGLPDHTRESIDEDDLYEAMDQMNGHWVKLEKDLYGQAFPNGLGLTLYDLSSTYFEGSGPHGLAQYGHSRDHRSDRPQIILAVATDAQGVPLHVSVLRGHRADTTTLQGFVKILRRRFEIREAVLAFDGGMSKIGRAHV